MDGSGWRQEKETLFPKIDKKRWEEDVKDTLILFYGLLKRER